MGRMSDGPPFKTSAALQSWLEEHGIGHLAHLNVEAVATSIPRKSWHALHAFGARRFLIDLARSPSLRHATDRMPLELRDVLPEAVWGFMQREREHVAKARRQIDGRLAPPSDPQALELHARLIRLRQSLGHTVAPRCDEALSIEQLQVKTELPGFVFRDIMPSQVRTPPLRFSAARVELRVGGRADGVSCTCGWTPCEHALAAIDTALKWLHSSEGTEERDTSLHELTRPTWEHQLAAMQRVFDVTTAEPLDLQVVWALEVLTEDRIEVEPWVRRRGKRGQLGAPRRTTGRHLLAAHGSALSPQDIRAAERCSDTGETPRAVLEALVGHPHVVRHQTEHAIWIERVPVGLVAQDRQGSTWVSAAIDGVPLPSPLVDRVRRAKRQDPLFIFDGQRLSLLDVSRELQGVLEVLQREGNLFPPEGRPALVKALSSWSSRIPVAMPRSVLGELVQPTPSPVLRLKAYPRGAVHVELRVRPLPESNAFAPGKGSKDIHVRRGERSLHAVRNFDQEIELAKALHDQLALAALEPLDEPFSYRLETAQAALAFVAEIEQRSSSIDYEWIDRPLRVVANVGPGSLHIDIQKKRNWFGVLGGLSVQGERVELARLLDANRRRERYVEIASQTYVELTEALQQHLQRMEAHAEVSPKGIRVSSSWVPEFVALELAGAQVRSDDAWQELKTKVCAAQALEPEVPPSLQATLRPYQVRGFRWLARLTAWGAGGVLADDMGLGKTLQALALLLMRGSEGPALVVAPTSLLFVWKHEAQRFAPSLRMVEYAEATDRAHAVNTLGCGDVLLLSYGLFTRDIETLKRLRFATAVFDEAHNLKNPKAQRTRAARILSADAKVALSGTPLENHLGELWSLFSVLFPGLLGNWERFRRRFAIPIEKVRDPRASAALAQLLHPFMLRRTKAEVAIDLPPRQEVRVPVVLSAEHWRLYEDARLGALSDLETDRRTMREQDRRVEVLAALTRLRLLVCHPRLYDEHTSIVSSKTTRFIELAQTLVSQGQRALVFSQFTSHLALVQSALDDAGIATIRFDGQTPTQVREERVRAFQDGDVPLFLISLKAGGVGLNLTAATNVILLDPWWNPAVEDQASDRAHRLGQQHPVTIYRFFCVGTIEEQMLDLHVQKRSLVERVLAGTAQADVISTQDLIDLLSGQFSSPSS